MNAWKSATVLTVCLAAAGCVLVVNPDETSDSAWDSAWQRDGGRYEERGYAPRPAGAGIAERVARRYGEDELLRDADIRVTARDGTVSLHGRVRGMEDFDRAVELALATDGVTEVESRLTVQIDRPPSAAEEDAP
ncbi:MAG TPA: BON domain-containing protein [Gammaproteobacteria bacterium]|nr:BON domain-containing protein [Gammaproteobacteria bacterium]